MAKTRIRDNVEEILKDYPQARDSDKALILLYWKMFDGLPMSDNDSVQDFKTAFMSNSTSTESIRRSRQLIQQEGKYLPTNQKVIKARTKKELEMVDAIVYERQVV